jgi:hypothetical protein
MLPSLQALVFMVLYLPQEWEITGCSNQKITAFIWISTFI